MPWLEFMNPIINWNGRSIQFHKLSKEKTSRDDVVTPENTNVNGDLGIPSIRATPYVIESYDLVDLHTNSGSPDPHSDSSFVIANHHSNIKNYDLAFHQQCLIEVSEQLRHCLLE